MNPDDPFDQGLRQALQAEPEPADAGFSLRVMAALPAQRARRRSKPAPQALRLTALVLAQAALAALLLAGLPEAETAVGAGVLLALMSWWSLPRRFGL